MKPCVGRVSRLTRSLAGSGLIAALAAVAHAQVLPPGAVQLPDIVVAAPHGAGSYQDHYIAGGTLTPDISSGYFGSSDTTSLARSIRIDGVLSVLTQQGPDAPPSLHEDGAIVDVQWDTASYGAWSGDAAARTGGSARSAAGNPYGNASFSLHERGMPFDDGWQADAGLGDINTPIISLARLQPRFLLTSTPMAGADTEWRGPAGLQLVAGAGDPGIFEGIKVPTFQTLGGTTATLGAQWTPAPHWEAGGELAAARDVTLYYLSLDNTATSALPHFSSSTGYLSTAWQDGGSRAQFNVIDGSVAGSGNSLGAWFDASRTRGAITNSVGLFRIDPNLAWGNQAITNDVQGGYYRLGYLSRRWVADVGVDQVSSVSGNGANTTFVNADARYQLSRDIGIGGVANIRHTAGDNAWSLEGYVDNVNRFGTGRVQLDWAIDPQVRDATLTLQQSWAVRAGSHLSTSAALDRISGSTVTPALTPTVGEQTSVLRLAVYGGGDLTARLSIDGSVQWATTVQGRAAPATSADVSLTWQLARAWSVLGTYYDSRVGSWTPLIVTSPLSPPTPTVIPATGARGVFLTVRYQDSRGSHFAPLGGMPGGGAGRLSGVVYLDLNENGRFDAGESGAPNVTVILDGRFSTRTDSNGRFDFPAIAAGHHVLTVQPDNLPLPWTLLNEGRTEVDVGTRERVVINIGAVRLK